MKPRHAPKTAQHRQILWNPVRYVWVNPAEAKELRHREPSDSKAGSGSLLPPKSEKANPMNQDTMADTSSALKEAASSVASDIKVAAVEKFDQAMTGARSKADDAKAGVASEVKDVALALRRASEELRGGSAQERTLGTIASSLADASDSIRDKDLGEIVQMVSKVARDNPVLFLGGAALLGFAASRYAKASARPSNGVSDVQHPDDRQDVAQFVAEGNPNTQPIPTTP